MKRYLLLTILLSIGFLFAGDKNQEKTNANPPIYIAFLWHMHQPIYWPYESIVQTDQNARWGFSISDIHNQRTGPYTSWPKDAVNKGVTANLPHFGAQVSFSGSLVENLNNLEASGNGNFYNWKSNWNAARTLKTSLGNPRLDMVGFGYHHPLMGLIDYTDIRKQIQQHKAIFNTMFGGSYSKGMFPPENAFSERMIPALVDEGIEWVLVDNIHFDRSTVGYPFNTSGNLYEMNKADQVNPDPNDWVQLNDLWAPTKNSARWGRQPHYAQYIDPSTGQISKMIVVPADRYMGNEDGRGGFGALNYESVMSQLESYNTDSNHPILIVLHHDGDNYGGGSEGYYHGNMDAFVNWLQANPSRFVCTTIQDYLQMFPPDQNDIIHVEDGSWSGADNGDPEFKKWNGDPGTNGYSPDRNSWGVITAAKNIVFTAEQINADAQGTKDGWHYLANAEASDYWYWDGSEGGKWDSHPTRGSNLAVNSALSVAKSGQDLTGPTIYLPQREPYNPGGTEWNIEQASDFKVWSYVFDINGLKSVTLKVREDNDGTVGSQNQTYTGGSDVGAWQDLSMTGTYIQSTTDPAPLYKAKEFSAKVTGYTSKLLDYYIEAVDSNNNISKSPIKHVWVGQNNGGGGGGGTTVWWTPEKPTKDDTIKVFVASSKTANLHWGVNYNGATWVTPNNAYWPVGTTLFNGTGPAVQTPFNGPVNDTMQINIGPFNNAAQTVNKIAFVIHYIDNTWDNNGGSDYHIDFGTGGGTSSFVMDGALDNGTVQISSNTGMNLYAGWNGSELYVATQSAPSSGNDTYIFIADSQRTLVTAPWAKAGKVAGWNAFLANESTNNYLAWTDGSGSAASGSYLEGALNVVNEFGYVPSKIYISAVRYGTADGGALVKQTPSGNSDANVDGNEFYPYDYSVTAVDLTELLPQNFDLKQNYPNPFNPSTRIGYVIHKEGPVQLKVYDMLGKEVASLVNEVKQPGIYNVNFNASGLSSGIYFYSLRSEGKTLQRKMMLIK